MERVKRVVVKVGTATLYENGSLSSRIDKIVGLLADLHRQEYQIILVSSGAVGAGYGVCQLDRRNLVHKQALAAIGQPLLMKEYRERFAQYQIVVAQVLLTAADFDSRRRTQNAQQMIEVLLENRCIPIINENDSVSIEEMIIGDNDQLSAYVTYYFGGDLLVILSDIDAFYDRNPQEEGSQPLMVVTSIKEEWLNQQCNPNDQFATGGIVTKLKAAKFLMERGIPLYLTSGFDLQNFRTLLLEGVQRGGTLFVPIEKWERKG
ncbi:MAG: glutamate 5-kinase [Campylobacterales bacterium]